MTTASRNRRWGVLALCFAARVGIGFQFQTMGSVADPLVRTLGLSFTEVGTLIGLFMMPGLFLALPFGFAGRWASDRMLTAAGFVALAAGGAIAASADGFLGLALGRVLGGAGFVLANIYLTKMIVDWFAGRELATAMAVLVMSWPFGIAMGQVGHGWLAAHGNWRMAFGIASAYCLAGALALAVAYRPPADSAPAAASWTWLDGREWTLTLVASLVWATFNAGYIVFLAFAPRVLAAGGMGALQAASTASLASWLLIFSGAICGQIADRTGRTSLIMTACMAVAVGGLLLLPQTPWAVADILLLGLVGFAPAGVVMALTGESMAPHKRALGMGVFYSAYYLLNAPAPAAAGWLYDRTRDPVAPILFAAALFALTWVGYLGFRLLKPSR